MTGAELRSAILSDAVLVGLRTAVASIFIFHGLKKFVEFDVSLGLSPMFVQWMGSFGVSPELAFLIAIAEIITGILLIVGVLSRLSASVIAIIMMATLIAIREWFAVFSGENGYEFDLALLAAALVMIVMGPGRISIAQLVQRLPRCLH